MNIFPKPLFPRDKVKRGFPGQGGQEWVTPREGRTGAVYLEGDFCQAACALDVEAEDGQPQVGLVLHGLFACIELLALVDVLSTRLTPVRWDEGSGVTSVRWLLWVGSSGVLADGCLHASWDRALPPSQGSLSHRYARSPPPGVLFSLIPAWPSVQALPFGEATRPPRLGGTCCHTLPEASLVLMGHPGLPEGDSTRRDATLERGSCHSALPQPLPRGPCTLQAQHAGLLDVPTNTTSSMPPPRPPPLLFPQTAADFILQTLALLAFLLMLP